MIEMPERITISTTLFLSHRKGRSSLILTNSTSGIWIIQLNFDTEWLCPLSLEHKAEKCQTDKVYEKIETLFVVLHLLVSKMNSVLLVGSLLVLNKHF